MSDSKTIRNVRHLQNASPVKILRSQIDTDDFNPREITPENRKRLKKSIESFGLIGAPIYNKRTHHVVGGHQRLSALDSIMNRAEYELDVIEVDLSEKDEARLNIALNNPDLQGTYNFAAIDQLCKEMGLDPEKDCLFSPEMVAVEFPDFTHSMEGFGSVPKKEVSEEEQEHYRAERERMRTRQKERENELGGYNIAETKGVISVVFRTESEKRSFLESAGQDPDRNAINFEEFRKMLS